MIRCKYPVFCAIILLLLAAHAHCADSGFSVPGVAEILSDEENNTSDESMAGPKPAYKKKKPAPVDPVQKSSPAKKIKQQEIIPFSRATAEAKSGQKADTESGHNVERFKITRPQAIIPLGQAMDENGEEDISFPKSPPVTEKYSDGPDPVDEGGFENIRKAGNSGGLKKKTLAPLENRSEEKATPVSEVNNEPWTADAYKPKTEPVARAGSFRANGPVAVLEGREIAFAEFYDAMLRACGKAVFNRMVNRMLLEDEAERRGIVVTRDEINAAFAEHEKKFKATNQGDSDFLEVLNRNYGMTPQAYKAKVVWVELVLEKLLDDKLHISDSDLFNYYYSHKQKYIIPEKVKASHILINPLLISSKAGRPGARSAGAEEWKKAFKLALDLQEKIQGGADFAALAREYSDDKATAQKGGFIGLFTRGATLKPIEDAAFLLKPGEVSEVIKTMYGYHIVKVLGKVPESSLSFTDAKERVREDYTKYMVQAHSSTLLIRLRAKAEKEGRLKVIEPFLRLK